MYSHAPSATEFRACLGKHIAHWQQRARKARAANRKWRRTKRRGVFVAPWLWIVAAGTPKAIFAKLELKPARGWPAGVYFFGADVLRVGIILASELPKDRSTLLIRLMAGGPMLFPAIEDLVALPPDAYERTVAQRVLLDLHSLLAKQPKRTSKEQKFMVTMQRTWEEARAEARAEGRAEAVLAVLRGRGITVPDAARKRILAQRDLRQLERWLEKASVATSIEDVIDARTERRASRAGKSMARSERSARRPARASVQR
ncbi:MAG: hypothetical protein E6J90_32375 [Deltaproteobacteria bacterium]|nr:MAG: hypothetical protein E6J90_32375 [Deltaproteobacteria bacterium]TMQ14099.1 MAG: hypothetical protein E6J91_16445 [Deltaproteobacteria bacterium]